MLLSKILISSMAAGAAIGASMQVHAESADKLAFNSAESRQATLSMPSGETVNSTFSRSTLVYPSWSKRPRHIISCACKPCYKTEKLRL